MTDNVNNPKHYTAHPSGIECIQITEHMNFNLGNAMKYIWRTDLNNDVTTVEFKVQILNFEKAVDETLESIRGALSELTGVTTYIG